MRPAFSRAVLCLSVLCLLAAGFASAQTSSAEKKKLSKRVGQPALATVAAPRATAKSRVPPPVTTDTWTGAGGTANWSNASNWNNGALTTGDSIVINATTATTVDDFNISIANLTLSNAGDSVTTTGAQLSVNGAIINNGTINLDATVGGNQGILFVAGNSTLSGTGVLVLSDGQTQNYISGATGAILTNSSTIEGGWITAGGYTGVGLGQIAFANSGTINANLAGGTLDLDPISSVGSTNTGTLEATNGATLRMTGGTWTQSGAGTISAANASTVSLQSGVSITGGTLTTTGTGVITQNAGGTATLSNLINAGTLDTTGGNLNVSGTITNNGTINLMATVGGNQGVFNLTSNTTLTGSGALILGDGQTQNFITGTNGAILTNASTIEGGWKTQGGYAGIGQNEIALANSGTINANLSGGTLNLDPIGSVISTNTGTLEATGGGTLQMQGGTWTQSGAGKISAATGSTISLQDGVSITGGKLITAGTGVIIQNAGGTATLSNLTNAGTLETTGGDLDVSGTITNTGTINLIATVGGNQGILNLTANTTLTGSGALILGDGQTQNFITGTSGTILTNTSTIEGGSKTQGGYAGVGQSTIALVNSGTINANLSGGTLYLDPISSVTSTNSGTMEATNGATLLMSGGTWTQTGAGKISAANGSIVALQNGVSITGGTLTTSGTGVIAQNDGGTVFLNNLTNTGTYDMQAPGVTELSGTIINNGAINMLANVAGEGQLNLAANTTLKGTGVLLLGNETTQNVIGGVSGTILTNASTINGGTNMGGGSFDGIGNGQILLANSGTINSNVSSGLLYVNPLGSGTNTNTGKVEATNGGTLILDGSTWTQTGAGTISAGAASTVELTAGVSVTGGTLTTTGTGMIEETNGQTVSLNGLTNSGTYNILDSATTKISGTITNNGTINLKSTGSPTSLYLTANTTLAGTGVVVLNSSGNNIIDGVAGTVLTNASTIEGTGNIGNNHITITNNGTFDSNVVGGTLAILPGSGGFTNYNGTTTTLTGGTYIANGGNITFASGGTTGIKTLAANVVEENGGQLLDTSNSNANALAGLTSITSSGSLTTSVNFTDAGSFSNAGSLTILGGTTFKVGSLAQISAGSLTAGAFVLDANLSLTGATQNITTNAASLTLAGGTIKNANGSNALAALANNTGKLTIAGSQNVSTTAASFNNTGTLTINSGSTFTAPALTQISAGVLSGGTFVLGGNLDLASGISVTTNSSTLTLEGGTIMSGTANALAGLNKNTKSLTLASNANFTTAGNFTNQGTLAVNSGSTFAVNGNLTNYNATSKTLTGGSYTVGGTLSAKNLNIVTDAANLTLDGTGEIENSTNSTNALAGLTTIASNGALTLAQNANFTAAANFTNSGKLTVNSGSTFGVTGTLTNLSSGTLTGGTYTVGGTLQLASANGGITTNAATLTLTGTAAKILDGTTNALSTFNNNTGSFTLTGGASLTSASSNFTNSGTVTVNKGSTLTVGGTANSYTQSAGTTTVDGTLTAGTAGISVTGGTIQGAGTLKGNTSNGGIINVGDAGKAGLLKITGTYSQLSTGAMNVSIGGTAAGTGFSQLQISGTASLGGTLTAALVNSFTPTVGQTFTVLTASSVSGTFTNSTIAINSTEHFVVSYTSSSVVLTVVSGAASSSGNPAKAAAQMVAATAKPVLGTARMIAAASRLRHQAAAGVGKPVRGTGVLSSSAGTRGPGSIRGTAVLALAGSQTPRIWERQPLGLSNPNGWKPTKGTVVAMPARSGALRAGNSELSHPANPWMNQNHTPARMPLRIVPSTSFRMIRYR